MAKGALLEHAKHGSTYSTIMEDRREKEATQQRILQEQRQEEMAGQEAMDQHAEHEDQIEEEDDGDNDLSTPPESSSEVPPKIGTKRKSVPVEDEAPAAPKEMHASRDIRSRALRMAALATPDGSVTTQPGRMDVYEELATMNHLKFMLLNKRDYPSRFRGSKYVADLEDYISRLESLRDFSIAHAGPEPAKRARASSKSGKKKDSADDTPQAAAEDMTVDAVIRAAVPSFTFMMKIKTEDIRDINQAYAFVSQVKSRLMRDDQHYSNGGHYESSFLQSVEEYYELLTDLQIYHHKLDSESAYGERLMVTVKKNDAVAANYTSAPLVKVEEAFRKVSETKDLGRLQAIKDTVYDHVYEDGGVDRKLRADRDKVSASMPKREKLVLSRNIFALETTREVLIALSNTAGARKKEIEDAS
ncbi:hypothetical protein PRZ48_012884 [Zasmidium cellare]|uniref:Uncharacterized protein n=1 Tax=Zasmidium cellare TaxID=395010 RepID=A0ABR0E2G7_ZASCE|nr:hypothetical protein PRZ48_012884 [Zasmidium cellare]